MLGGCDKVYRVAPTVPHKHITRDVNDELCGGEYDELSVCEASISELRCADDTLPGDGRMKREVAAQ